MTQLDPMSLLADLLARHGPLPEPDRAAILSLPFRTRSHGRSPWAVRQGDVQTTSLLLLSGTACQHHVLPCGTRQITSVHIAGDLIGLHCSEPHVADQSLEVVGQARIVEIEQTDLSRLAAARSAVARAFWAETLAGARITREWLVNVGRRDARARILYLLCELGLRYEAQGLGARDDFELPLTQNHIADATGLTPVHVNRTLQGLAAEGTVDREGRRVTIPRWRHVVGEAQFDFGHLLRHSSVAGGAAGVAA